MAYYSKTRSLPFSGDIDPSTDFFRRFSLPIFKQFLKIYAWHFYMDVDPVHHRTRNAFLVARHGLVGAEADFLSIFEVATWLGMNTIEI